MKFSQVIIGTIILILACSLCAAQDKRKLAYGILVDNTGSMRSQFNTVLTIAKDVVNQIHENGPVSIFDFHSERPTNNALPIARIENSQNKQLLDRTIDNLYVEGGQTTLLDAIAFIGESLSKQSADAEKVIILITDGEERSSKTKRRQLIEDLKKQKIKVFAIGLVQDLEKNRSKAIALLKGLASETDGRAVFPDPYPKLQDVLKELAIPVQ